MQIQNPQLALVTIMQFAEGVSDRQAAEAVRTRIDWKYALRLEREDEGFVFSVPCEFRARLIEGHAEYLLFEAMLTYLKLIKAGGRQRTDATHVLAAVRATNRVVCVGETLRAALNTLAEVAPGWLRSFAPDEWYERYAHRIEEYRLPWRSTSPSLLPLLFGLPLILLPVHIVFLELIIDPASSLVFESEPESPALMQRPPRNPQQPMFSGRFITLSLLQGGSVLAVFLLSLSLGRGEATVRAMTFSTPVFANLGLIFVNRSQSRPALATLRSHNAAFWWVIAGGLLLLALVLFLPWLRDLFRFSPLTPTDLLICLGTGIIGILWFEVFKPLCQKAGPA